MKRGEMLAALREGGKPWDMVIIGGGATGLGAAVDAAARGYRVALIEQSDFAKGTSSRSTKLVHGGVRYLQQGNVSLVMEALKERGLLLRNAPHLVRDVAFIVPSYAWWESPFYGIGLKVYDMLAGRYGFGKSSMLSRQRVIAEIPSINTTGLLGGTRYFDGQFDDARLAINLATTAAEQGAVVVNYVRAERLVKDEAGWVRGVIGHDLEGGAEIELSARVVVNATGPFADEVRRLDQPEARSIIAPSQGVHIVLERAFLPGTSAIMVPHTDDGRVMFAIPWHDVVVVGTTDTAIETVSLEPQPQEGEIDFILDTANRYLARPATRADVRSVFTGIRPLVRMGDSRDTAALSRDHTILIEPRSGLLTVAGGKWTTYRRMAQDVVDQAVTLADLEPAACTTKELRVHGCDADAARYGRLATYGSDAPRVQRLDAESAAPATPLHPRLALTEAEVRWACREEMARTVDDVLSRRTRSLLFDAAAARECAPRVAEIMAEELGQGAAWAEAQVRQFETVAARHLPGQHR